MSLTNKSSGKRLLFQDGLPSLNLKGRKFLGSSDFRVTPVERGLGEAAHLEVSLVSRYEGLELRRVYKIYPQLPTISLDPYLRYMGLHPPAPEDQPLTTGVEGKKRPRVEPELSYVEHLPLHGKHWSMKAVTFVDQTDGQDNLVSEQDFIPYNTRGSHRGNLLLADDLVTGYSFFVLKEAPNTSSQLHYPGADFIVSNKLVNVPFSGFPEANPAGKWQRGYTLTTGVAEGPQDRLFALRSYLKGSINYDPGRHEMIMMNTWGDRGKDGKVNERFVLRELEGAARLGITHFQIDDGWQQGLSMNSASASGSLWDAWTAENWVPHSERFPNGLETILASAREKGIELGLWFHPTNENDYATWKTDADIVVDLYRKTGIRYFKIDGVKLPTKESEINLDNFFNEVKTATQGQVFFNLDLTADVRGGYFMFRQAGNLFLENRYTDAGNYYPFHTLRNLWMLARYFPPELIQTEFLNKWRNPDRYPANDPFAPGHYGFDYVFAVTMVGQPLAWMEASNLPEEAYAVAPDIKKYRSVMADLHAGTILPIGEMPSGRSWTGFQSVHGESGYLLVFREANARGKAELDTYLPGGRKVKFEQVLGTRKGAKCKVGCNGKVEVALPQQNSFALFKYQVGR
ncbi:hypothetical protein BH24BAC1_BH24BAC1_40030 [soil metagenome]